MSDAYRRVHAIAPQTAPCGTLRGPPRRSSSGVRQSQDDDLGAGMGFWPSDSPFHVARGSLRGRLLEPESIPESMPSVESYDPSSLPASQDGVYQGDLVVGTPQSYAHMRMGTPPLSDTSNEGSVRDAHIRARCVASAGMVMSSHPKAEGVEQEYPDAATPLLTAKELMSRRRQGMQSTNRRKRRSSDANTAPSTRSAELARTAALMVAAPGSSIHVEHPSSSSGPLEDSLMGSMCGSARLSSRSEPLTGRDKRNSSLGSTRVSSGSRSGWRNKGLRTRLSGNRRPMRRRSMTSEASSDCSPKLLHTGTAAALVPPMTAVDGPLTLLPTCPVAQHNHAPSTPSHAGQHAHSIWENEAGPSTAHVAPHIPPLSPMPPGEYSFVIPHDPGTHTFTHTGMEDADSAQGSEHVQQQPSVDAAQAGEWAAGELAGLNLGATAAAHPAAHHTFNVHLPRIPQRSPRSPSPQRICRRLETTPVAEAADAPHNTGDGRPPATPRAQMEPGFESVYSGQACARSRMAGAVAGKSPKEAEDSDSKKMQVAMQRFERELRGRLVAHGVEESSPVGNEIVPEHRPQMISFRRHSGTSHDGPRPAYIQERRLSERQFDDKDRLEEGTLSALAACMHRRIT